MPREYLNCPDLELIPIKYSFLFVTCSSFNFKLKIEMKKVTFNLGKLIVINNIFNLLQSLNIQETLKNIFFNQV